MRHIDGDLIYLMRRGQIDVLIHGCNCQCTMGSGIAAQIRAYWPKVYQVDNDFTHKGKWNKLGTIMPVTVENEIGETGFIINAYTQFEFGATADGGRDVNYAAVSECFRRIREIPNIENLSIGIPKIGAGLAGGDWDVIEEIIDFHLHDCDDAKIVNYVPF